jgi:Ca-activated chloride channel homolog
MLKPARDLISCHSGFAKEGKIMRKYRIPVLYLRAMAAVLMIVLFNPGIAQDTDKTKIETEPVNIDVIVKDAEGKRVADLKKEDFEIYEDGALQEITHFRPMNQPLRLVLLFDTSASMGLLFPAVKDEAVKFVESLNQLDEIMVASFSNSLQWHTEWGGKAAAANEILDLESASVPGRLPSNPGQGQFPRRRPIPPRMPVPPRGPLPPGRPVVLRDVDTNLYGAMHTLFVRFGGRGGNEVVLLISDGKDSVDGSLSKQRPVKDSKQVVQKAQESWAQIYTACFSIERSSGLSPFGGGRGSGSNCKFLSEISDATGGRAFEFESQSDLALVLKKILEDLRSQYGLAYSPSSQGKKAGLHKIRVTVKRPDVVVHAREGYLVSK